MKYVIYTSIDMKDWFLTKMFVLHKSGIKSWIDTNIKACGLDWQVGNTIKFRNSNYIYEFRKEVKNDQ